MPKALNLSTSLLPFNARNILPRREINRRHTLGDRSYKENFWQTSSGNRRMYSSFSKGTPVVVSVDINDGASETTSLSVAAFFEKRTAKEVFFKGIKSGKTFSIPRSLYHSVGWTRLRYSFERMTSTTYTPRVAWPPQLPYAAALARRNVMMKERRREAVAARRAAARKNLQTMAARRIQKAYRAYYDDPQRGLKRRAHQWVADGL